MNKYSTLTKKQKLFQGLQQNSKINESFEDWLSLELTYSSNAIEGNILTRIETAEVIEIDMHIEKLKGKSIVKNIKDYDNKMLRIGELSKISGETIHTLHFWIKEGLIKAKNHTKGGYQLFDKDTLKIIKQIRHLQQTKRLTLSEIKQKLA